LEWAQAAAASDSASMTTERSTRVSPGKSRQATVVNLNVTYKFSDNLALEGYGGTTLDSKLRLEN
jgi:outer membrane protein W